MKLRPLKWYEKLLTAKGRRRESRYLIEGRRQVIQMLESSPDKVEEVLVLEGETSPGDTHPVRILNESQMKAVTDSETVPVLIAVGIIPEAYTSLELPENIPSRVLLLEDVQDPGNVGTLLRGAAAFGFSLVILTEGCADPFAPKVVRSTAGAMGTVDLRRGSSAFIMVDKLKKHGFQLVTAHINGGQSSLSSVKKLIFALGNEGNGVSQKLRDASDDIYTIPFDNDRVESLNVAVAGSIGMADSYRKD